MDGRCRIDGTILNLIFQNEENGYTVLRLVTGDGEVVTVVGTIPCAAPGENLIVTGRWVSHPTHGDQVQAEEVERHMPTTEAEIRSYLSSGVVKGVGPATAERIVDRFGVNALRVMEEEPELLGKIKGITARKAMEIAESYRYQTGMRRLLDFLSVNDLPLSLATRLYRRYGGDALEQVRANPYLLVDELYGVDFAVMDEIALSMGVAGDSRRRVEAAVLFELSYNLNNGHVFLPRDKLLAAAGQLIDCPPDTAEIALDDLIARGAVRCERVAKVDGLLPQPPLRGGDLRGGAAGADALLPLRQRRGTWTGSSPRSRRSRASPTPRPSAGRWSWPPARASSSSPAAPAPARPPPSGPSWPCWSGWG